MDVIYIGKLLNKSWFDQQRIVVIIDMPFVTEGENFEGMLKKVRY